MSSRRPGGELWPFRFEAHYTITVGAELGLELSVRNTGAEEVTFEEALHTYLCVSDVREVQVDGLDGATYADKTSGGALVRQGGPGRLHRRDGPGLPVERGRERARRCADHGRRHDRLAEHDRLEPLGRQGCGDVGLRRRGVADDGVGRDRQRRRDATRSSSRRGTATPCTPGSA